MDPTPANPAKPALWLLLIVPILLLAGLGGTYVHSVSPDQSPSPSPGLTQLPSTSPTQNSPPSLPTATRPLQPTPTPKIVSGWMALSLVESGYAHLFAYAPNGLPLTRLTAHPWDDREPAISPDGRMIAFTSRRNGYWDLYLLDLSNGEENRLTDTPEYDGAPAWSPDGQWLAYETYLDDSLEIAILPVADPTQRPVRLTAAPSAEFSPAWSPGGRQIAFVSDRSGSLDIWLADLDNLVAGPRPITQITDAAETHPTWSPDGALLAWTVTGDGEAAVWTGSPRDPSTRPNRIGSGDWPCWTSHGEAIASHLTDLEHGYLSATTRADSALSLPPQPLPGELLGLSCTDTAFPAHLPAALARTSSLSPTPPWSPSEDTPASSPSGRDELASLPGVDAPNPLLSHRVSDSFEALRQRVIAEAGWDFLGTLENAFLPITSPLPPGLGEDWLLTGRAFAASLDPLRAGWMASVRVPVNGSTTWRLYLRARYQDGSLGAPLRQAPWELNFISGGDPQDYERGGHLSPAIPGGYWVDFTGLASRYGWSRLPARTNWQTFFAGAYVNEFVQTGGLDWRSAMLEIYPPEALETPQVPTPTPSPTPYWYRPPTAAPTDLPTPIPTPRPTWTPLPEG